MDMYGHAQSILFFIEHIHADTHAHTPTYTQMHTRYTYMQTHTLNLKK